METDEKRRGKEAAAAALSGGHLCHACGYQYPNPHPSAKLRRSHRKHCGKAAQARDVVEEEKTPPAGDLEDGNAAERTQPDVGGKGGEVERKSEANGGAALLGSATEVGESVEDKAVAGHTSSNGTGVHHITREINETGQINCTNTENASPDDKVVKSELSRSVLVDCSSNYELVNEGNGSQIPFACNNGSDNEVAKHCSELTPATFTNPAEREDSFDEYQDACPFLHQSDSEDGALSSSELHIEINSLNPVLPESSAAANEISLGTNGLCNDQFSGELNLDDLSAGSKVGNDSENGILSLAGLGASLKLIVPYESYRNVGNNHTCMVANEPKKSESIGDLDASSLQEAHSVVFSADSQSTCFRKMQGATDDTMHELHNMYEASPRPEAAETSNAQLEALTGCSSKSMLIENELMLVDSENNPTDSSTELSKQNWLVKDTSEENPSVQKTSGFTEDEVCNKQIDPEVPTEDQFPRSQICARLPAGQTSRAKNPFDLDDDRNDDLFELPSDSCYLEVPSSVSEQVIDSASLLWDQPTVSNQTKMSEARHRHNSDDASSSSENGHPIGPKVMPDSSVEPVMNTHLVDVPLMHQVQEDEAHTSGISFVPYQVAPTEAGPEENTHTKDIATEDMTVCHTTYDIETKQAVDTTVSDTYTVNVEANKVTDDVAAKINEVQVCNVEEKHADSTKEVSLLQSMSHLEDNKPTEDPNTKVMNAQVNADDLEGKWQTDYTSAEKTNAMVHIDNFEEMCDQATRANEVIALQDTQKVDENKQTDAVVGQEGDNKKEEIGVTGGSMNSGRIRVPLKVLLAEASAENKGNKPSAKERVLPFGRRASKNDNSSAKSGSPVSGSDDHRWDSPAKLPRKDRDKSSKGRKQPWMPFICCHSVR